MPASEHKLGVYVVTNISRVEKISDAILYSTKYVRDKTFTVRLLHWHLWTKSFAVVTYYLYKEIKLLYRQFVEILLRIRSKP